MNLDMSGLFHVCKGTCLCASGSGDGYGKGKVLYCYGEVVLQRANLRSDKKDSTQEDEDLYTFQIVQLVSIVVLLLALLLVLMTIKQGLTRIQKQVKRILVLMPPMSPSSTRPNTLEKKQVFVQGDKLMLKKAPNGNCMQHKQDGGGGETGYKLIDNSAYKAPGGEGLYNSRGERDSIRFEKEEVRSLNNYHLPGHEKIDRIDSFPESMAEVT